MLIQADAHTGRDRRGPGTSGAAPGRGQAAQAVDHGAQLGQQAFALRAVIDVALQPHAPATDQLPIQVLRHTAGRPAVIAPELHPV